jgi:hypothetical protein
VRAWHVVAARARADEVRRLAEAAGLPSLEVQWDDEHFPDAACVKHGRILVTSARTVVWYAEAPIGSILPPEEVWVDGRLRPHR